MSWLAEGSPVWGLTFPCLYRAALAPLLEACSLCFFLECFTKLFFWAKTVNYSHQNKVILTKLGNGSEITEATILWFYVCVVVVTGFSAWWGNFKNCLFNSRKFPFKFEAVLHLNDLVLFGNYIDRYVSMEKKLLLKLIHIHCKDSANNFTNCFHTNGSM